MIRQLFSSLSAKKYLRSLSEMALLYRPGQVRQLSPEENLNDRVVQSFFDPSKVTIEISESAERLLDISKHSSPAHSFYQVRLPFAHNDSLRKKMVQFDGKFIRTGRILELMDYIAANVSYRYCSPDSEKDLEMEKLSFISVTAAIDEIDFYHPIAAEQDCWLSGYVSCVGRSSMEVQIDVLQDTPLTGTGNRTSTEKIINCSAKFVMVARDKANGKAHLVPPLDFSQEKEKRTFEVLNELAVERQKNRKIQQSKALEFSPPSYQESVAIHSLTSELNSKNQATKWTSIGSTVQKNVMLMHLEDKNLSGKIFGGFILRLAYELGWLCAYRFLKVSPKVTHVDDVQFLAPVEIGTYVDFQSKICYVTHKHVHVVITCHNSKFTGQMVLTNVLRVTFQHGLGQAVNRVFPETIDDSHLYIEAMRRVNKLVAV